MAELEGQKRDLMRGMEQLEEMETLKEKEIKLLKRQIGDKEDDLKAYKKKLPKAIKYQEAMIKSVDDSLKRFIEVSKSLRK